MPDGSAKGRYYNSKQNETSLTVRCSLQPYLARKPGQEVLRGTMSGLRQRDLTHLAALQAGLGIRRTATGDLQPSLELGLLLPAFLQLSMEAFGDSTVVVKHAPSAFNNS